MTFDRAEFNGHLKDLPTITEVLKTKDDKVPPSPPGLGGWLGV